MFEKISPFIRIALAAALMAIAANCFLKYLWWSACYSAWYGIPKLAEQWKAAETRASFNGWCVIVLEFLSVTVLYTTLQLRRTALTSALSNGLRLALSIGIAGAGTAFFALALSWFKQAH